MAVHRQKKHGLGKHATAGTPAGYDGAIFQSKPAQVLKLRALLARIDHAEDVRHRAGNTLPQHVFRLRRAYVTDLMKRTCLMETGPEAFVLALPSDQRAAWLDSMIDAEGNRQLPAPATETRHSSHREFVRIAQVDGPLQDAIKLTVYLEGYRPTYAPLSAVRRGYKPSGNVGMAQPHIVPSMFYPRTVLEPQAIWSITTGLGTWTMWQEGGQPCLTGDFRPDPA